jgi:hypothetical protein
MQPEQLPHVELGTSPAPASAEKLPLGIKLAYGMPNFAGAAMVIPIAIHMNIFYSDVVLWSRSGTSLWPWRSRAPSTRSRTH